MRLPAALFGIERWLISKRTSDERRDHSGRLRDAGRTSVVDTNSLFVTEQLNNLGVEVTRQTRDRRRPRASGRNDTARAGSALVRTSSQADSDSTEDDLTRDVVAMALDRRQVFNPAINEGRIRAAFSNNESLRCPKSTGVRAMVIEGAHVLSNDRGTAPGQWIEEGGGVLMILLARCTN